MPRRAKPPLTADQRRRQIIDLLAGHLAAMPPGLAVSQSHEGETVTTPVLQGFRPEVSGSRVLASYAPPGQNLPESPQNRLELSAK